MNKFGFIIINLAEESLALEVAQRWLVGLHWGRPLSGSFFGLVMVLCWTGVVEAPKGEIRQHPETDSA